MQREVGDEVLEDVVAGDEVGVALDLHEHADLAGGVDVLADQALGRLALSKLLSLLAHGDAQGLEGLVGVAAGLLERSLALHRDPAPVF